MNDYQSEIYCNEVIMDIGFGISYHMFILLFGFLSQVVFSDCTAIARAVRKGVFSTSEMSSLEIEMVLPQLLR